MQELLYKNGEKSILDNQTNRNTLSTSEKSRIIHIVSVFLLDKFSGCRRNTKFIEGVCDVLLRVFPSLDNGSRGIVSFYLINVSSIMYYFTLSINLFLFFLERIIWHTTKNRKNVQSHELHKQPENQYFNQRNCQWNRASRWGKLNSRRRYFERSEILCTSGRWGQNKKYSGIDCEFKKTNAQIKLLH